MIILYPMNIIIIILHINNSNNNNNNNSSNNNFSSSMINNKTTTTTVTTVTTTTTSRKQQQRCSYSEFDRSNPVVLISKYVTQIDHLWEDSVLDELVQLELLALQHVCLFSQKPLLAGRPLDNKQTQK